MIRARVRVQRGVGMSGPAGGVRWPVVARVRVWGVEYGDKLGCSKKKTEVVVVLKGVLRMG